jgi:uncharacterized damage-inducible protein DinB
MSKMFKVQAYNNAWANLRIGKACASLPNPEMAKPRTGFFPSIIATLNHILIADWFYVSAFEGQSMGLDAFARMIPFPDLRQLIAEQRKVDERLIAVCHDPIKSADSAVVEMKRGDTVVTERFDRAFLHLVQHQIHHRGQVHCMLSGTSAAPPQLDEFFMSGSVDKARRVDDLEQLGISEEKLWGSF